MTCLKEISESKKFYEGKFYIYSDNEQKISSCQS